MNRAQRRAAKPLKQLWMDDTTAVCPACGGASLVSVDALGGLWLDGDHTDDCPTEEITNHD